MDPKQSKQPARMTGIQRTGGEMDHCGRCGEYYGQVGQRLGGIKIGEWGRGGYPRSGEQYK